MQMTNTPVCQIYLADEPHYLVDDAAEVLGVHRRTVIRWLDDDDVKLSRIVYDGRRICIPAGEVEQLAKELHADSDRPGGAPRPQPKPSDGPPRGEHR